MRISKDGTRTAIAYTNPEADVPSPDVAYHPGAAYVAWGEISEAGSRRAHGRGALDP